ncbi:unnamed protein product [Durusdinium trenchii]|uniref:ESCRT-II complex subunit VPS25 n=1 Tax=Durusdinium trenchii TaxID=1381693 RepID=A0ABP0NUF8_9DINO
MKLFHTELYLRGTEVLTLNISPEAAGRVELHTEKARKVLAEHLVQQQAALWADEAAKERLLVLWRSVAGWADLILQWAAENGLMGSVETVQSLMDGEAAEGQEFYGAPRELIMAALQELVRRNRATLFRGSSGSEGVKFLSA